MLPVTILIVSLLSSVSGFVTAPGVQHPSVVTADAGSTTMLKSSSSSSTTADDELVEPSQRDARYGKDIAQYLVDLHDAKSTFDFCGGMMFQMVLSEQLRDHLIQVTKNTKEGEGDGRQQQPVIFDATKPRMHQIADYEQSAAADNSRLFHGREIRQVPDAAGGRGFVLQLSLANNDGNDDPEGWTPQEIEGYDGWGHDSSRVWREGDRLEEEGFTTFKSRFGSEAFALHHRFYLHFDSANRMWLSAEDGCEGTPARSESMFAPLSKLFGR
eukprot:CAMPEP_0119004816 /NCGR_PEP_ID=MMETSP1176-20130426/1372_1 /TAXON_ID=265551 /ORGANISM="Synedropsis recta cf, Strain CCMP1620" /LENGTH=270 /DNA_ID=CAMNT_0006956565 /DNA_START=47 /DNA_END=859 /DNA_ORIENTATION=-